LAELLKQEAVRKMVTTLQERDDDAPGELVDAAYWIKGCSSLGRLRYAAMLRVGKLRTGSLCLLDIKEATKPAAPRAAEAAMPKDNAMRVVNGAEALSPNVGERMMAGRLLDTAVVIRELMPQDLKIEVDRLNREEAMSLAFYLAGVVGRAHGRQMNRATRNSWLLELARADSQPGCPIMAVVERR
jgi:uncharacterized protein (DUF2252 family)